MTMTLTIVGVSTPRNRQRLPITNGGFFSSKSQFTRHPASRLDSRYIVRYVQSTWNVHGDSAWLSGFQTKTRNALAMNPRGDTGAKLDLNDILIKDEV